MKDSDKYRKIYEDTYGEFTTQGKHVHHIVPEIYGGDLYDPRNMVAVSPEHHFGIHQYLSEVSVSEDDREFHALAASKLSPVYIQLPNNVFIRECKGYDFVDYDHQDGIVISMDKGDLTGVWRYITVDVNGYTSRIGRDGYAPMSIKVGDKINFSKKIMQKDGRDFCHVHKIYGNTQYVDRSTR